jgi:hypothetical protein
LTQQQLTATIRKRAPLPGRPEPSDANRPVTVKLPLTGPLSTTIPTEFSLPPAMPAPQMQASLESMGLATATPQTSAYARLGLFRSLPTPDRLHIVGLDGLFMVAVARDSYARNPKNC